MRDPRILVVDDQPDVRRLLSTVLETRGRASDAAGSIAEARALMQRTRYDILFLDVHLGDGCGLPLAGHGADAPLAAVITGGPELELVVEALRRGAYLHDQGKIGVSDRTLGKPGALSAEEQAVVRRHPELGVRLLAPLAFPQRVTAVVRSHHERFNGSGYPDGLRGDALDAMTSDRPCRHALPYVEVARELAGRSGEQFDPAVVASFLAEAPATWLTGGGT